MFFYPKNARTHNYNQRNCGYGGCVYGVLLLFQDLARIGWLGWKQKSHNHKCAFMRVASWMIKPATCSIGRLQSPGLLLETTYIVVAVSWVEVHYWCTFDMKTMMCWRCRQGLQYIATSTVDVEDGHTQNDKILFHSEWRLIVILVRAWIWRWAVGSYFLQEGWTGKRTSSALHQLANYIHKTRPWVFARWLW